MITGLVIAAIGGFFFGAILICVLASVALDNTETTSYLRGHRDGRASR